MGNGPIHKIVIATSAEEACDKCRENDGKWAGNLDAVEVIMECGVEKEEQDL
jgi:hypothetical protein